MANFTTVGEAFKKCVQLCFPFMNEENDQSSGL